MKLAELAHYLEQGREIEYSYCGKAYFSGRGQPPEYDRDRFDIYDVALKCNVFEGSLEDLLDFEFAPRITLRTAIKEFDFQYIL